MSPGMDLGVQWGYTCGVHPGMHPWLFTQAEQTPFVKHWNRLPRKVVEVFKNLGRVR